jgi:hypothetical protein
MRVSVSGKDLFSSQKRPDRIWGTPSSLFNGYWRFFLRGKAAELEAVADFKYELIDNFIYFVWFHGVDREKSTLPLPLFFVILSESQWAAIAQSV